MPPTENSPNSNSVEPPSASVLIVESKDSALVGKTVALPPSRFMIGRGVDVTGLQIGDYNVSRYHADITYKESEGGFFIRDLSSENGTKVNGAYIPTGEPVRLTDGDEIRLGTTVMTYSSLADPPTG